MKKQPYSRVLTEGGVIVKITMCWLQFLHDAKSVAKRSIVPLFIAVVLTSCLVQQPSSHESFALIIELKVPPNAKLEKQAVDLVTDISMSGAVQEQKEGEGGKIFTCKFLIFPYEHRRAIIIHPDRDSSVSQVFVLKIPRKPRVFDWSSWLIPDYVEKEDAIGSFMDNMRENDRDRNVPKDCIQMRYKVEKFRL